MLLLQLLREQLFFLECRFDERRAAEHDDADRHGSGDNAALASTQGVEAGGKFQQHRLHGFAPATGVA